VPDAALQIGGIHPAGGRLDGVEDLGPPPCRRLQSDRAIHTGPRRLISRRSRESLSSFSRREWMDRSPLRFGLPFSHISLELTSPTGRKYIPGVVKRGDSSAGAGIRGVPEKVISYP